MSPPDGIPTRVIRVFQSSFCNHFSIVTAQRETSQRDFLNRSVDRQPKSSQVGHNRLGNCAVACGPPSCNNCNFRGEGCVLSCRAKGDILDRGIPCWTTSQNILYSTTKYTSQSGFAIRQLARAAPFLVLVSTLDGAPATDQIRTFQTRIISYSRGRVPYNKDILEYSRAYSGQDQKFYFVEI